MLLQLKIMVFMCMLYFMYICMYHILCIYIYMYYIVCIYVYIYIIGRGSCTRNKCDYGIRTNGQWQKNKMPGSIFYPPDTKKKAPALLQRLKHSALYTIAARGCIVAKRREQCYNLRGVLLSRLSYNIARISPDSYKARAFRHFRQHWERSGPTCGTIAPGILSGFSVQYNHFFNPPFYILLFLSSRRKNIK